MPKPYYEDWPSSGYAIPKYHKQVTVYCPANDTMVTADEGIIADLQVLWHYGISTMYSCQGSGFSSGCRYIMLEESRDVEAVTELLPWAFANTVDREDSNGHGAVYARPGGALRGIFEIGIPEIVGDSH